MAILVGLEIFKPIEELMNRFGTGAKVFQHHAALKIAMKAVGRDVVKMHYASVINVQDFSEIENQEGEYIEISNAVDDVLSQGKFLWGPPDPQTVRPKSFAMTPASPDSQSRACLQTWPTPQ